MKFFYGILAMALLLGWTPVSAQEKQETSAPGFGPRMGQDYGPGMMRGMTPEQRQQHWEQMQQQGYQPGMGRSMTPEQRQQHWEQMRQRGYQPGMGRGYGPGMMQGMPPPAASEPVERP